MDRIQVQEMKILGEGRLHFHQCNHFLSMYSTFFNRTTTNFLSSKAVSILHCTSGVLCSETTFMRRYKSAISVGSWGDRVQRNGIDSLASQCRPCFFAARTISKSKTIVVCYGSLVYIDLSKQPLSMKEYVSVL